MVDEENPLVVTEEDFALATEEVEAPEENGHAEEEQEEEEEEEEDGEEDAYDTSDDEAVDRTVMEDMHKLEEDFPSFAKKYRLIKRIGEGW